MSDSKMNDPAGPDGGRQRKAVLPRILLVEDHASTAELMRKLLAAKGYEVRTVATYKEALQTAGQWLPDLLISDIGLPGKDGLEVLKTMRVAYPGLKAIVVSGHASPEDVEKSLKAGFAQHLSKPVDLAELSDVVRRLLVE